MIRGRGIMKKRAIDNLTVWFLVWPPSFVMCPVIFFFCLCAVFPYAPLFEVFDYWLLYSMVGGLFGAWFFGWCYRQAMKDAPVC